MHRINLYQTLLTEGQWSYINKVFFENDCRKRKNSLRSLFEAVLYLLISGCQWRMLPHDYPRWQLVYYYFRKWFREGRIEHLLRSLVRKIRKQMNQSESPSVGALDAQSVKWGNRKSSNGFDADKKVKGIKRNIIVAVTVSFCPAASAVRPFTIPTRHILCVGRLPMIGSDLRKFWQTVDIEVISQRILRTTSLSILRCQILQTAPKGSYPNLSDGWLKGHSPGWTGFVDYLVIMRNLLKWLKK